MEKLVNKFLAYRLLRIAAEYVEGTAKQVADVALDRERKAIDEEFEMLNVRAYLVEIGAANS